MQLGTQTIWPSQKGYIQTEPVAAAVIWINFTVKKPPSKENCVGLFCEVSFQSVFEFRIKLKA